MTPEERKKLVEEISAQVTEQLYRSLPDIVANLAASAQSHAQRFMEFYKNYPEFKDHTEIVGQVVGKIEGEDPLRSYDEMLELAVPKIRKAIEEKSKVNMKPVSLSVDKKFIENLGKI